MSARPRPHRHFPPLLLALLLAPALRPAERPGFPIPKWAEQNYYWVSSDAPMLSHMLSQPRFNASDVLLSSFIAHVDGAINAFLQRGEAPTTNQLFRTCNSDARGYGRSVTDVFGLRGLPDPFTDCLSDNVDTALYDHRSPLYSIDAVYDAMLTRFRLLDREAAFLVRSVLTAMPGSAHLLSNWTGVTSVSNSEWRRPNKRCRLSVLGFFRVDNLWYSDLSITNAAVLDNLPRKERQFMSELVQVAPDDDGTMTGTRALTMRLRRFVADDAEAVPMDNATTVFMRFRGQAKMSTFTSIYPEQNIAMQAAIDKADLGAQQADDALAMSNLAILFLPVTLNLVPIALFSLVTTRTMLVYTLFSDVLTVVPLTVKGIELVVLGRTRYRAIATRISSALNGTVDQAAAAELWSAECRTKDNVLPAGIVFLTLAIFFMVVGIYAEFWAAKFSKRRLQDAVLASKPGHVCVHNDENYDDVDYKQSMQVQGMNADKAVVISTKQDT